MHPFLILIAGLVLLTFAGDALVRGGVSIAKRLGVPEIILGLTIISMGTSAPELFVSLEAAVNGAAGIAAGNVVGSNIANVLLVLGLPALFAPVLMVESGVRRSTGFMVAISLVLILMCLDAGLSRLDGVILLVLLGIYLAYSIHAARKGRRAVPHDEIEDGLLKMPMAVLFLVLGFVGLYSGGQLTVDGALGIAGLFGLDETAVGTTIVALGTTLPELAATIAAGLRRSSGVAIGNVIGSNIFNILGILGVSALVAPLSIDPRLLDMDIWVMLASAVLVLWLAFRRKPLTRPLGALMSLAYCGYLYVALTAPGAV